MPWELQLQRLKVVGAMSRSTHRTAAAAAKAGGGRNAGDLLAAGPWFCSMPGAHRLFAPPAPAPALQANHAHSVAFILRTCSHELALRSEPAIYIADACTAMEMSDAAISATASFRGAPVKTEAIVRLRTACLQVLSAAIGWQAFRWGVRRGGAYCRLVKPTATLPASVK